MRVLILFFMTFFISFVQAQVKINEVLYSTADDQIELKNFGSTAVDVSSWWLCSVFVYNQISTLNVISGSLNIPPGGILALSGKSLNNTAADLALYNSSVFTSTTAMQDYVEWGRGGQGRESVAVSKGIWTAGDFVPTVAAGHSIEYDGDGNSSSDWFDQPNPTIGSENGILTSVEEQPFIPTKFHLEQNFPNPFNPTTVMPYTIPQGSGVLPVKLEIFNVLGQKVRTLIQATQPAGIYRVSWDGTDDGRRLVSSGIYIYRLKAGDFVDMKRMVFLR